MIDKNKKNEMKGEFGLIDRTSLKAKEDQLKRRVPFVSGVLLKAIKKFSDGKISEIKTMCRSSTILPIMVGKTIHVHNGKEYLPVIIVDDMVGYKLGEFSLTRKFKGHGGDKDKARAKSAGKSAGKSASKPKAAAPKPKSGGKK
jgi:small subunit ribosomal protein S19